MECSTPVVKTIFDDTKGRIGAKKIKALMMVKGYTITAKRITRLMKEMNLESICRKRKSRNNPAAKARYRKNVLKRRFDQTDPNKVWASDITHIHLNYRHYYLCTVIDLFSRKVIAHNVSEIQDTALVKKTFEDAYRKRKPNGKLIYHSDQGCQYTSYKFRKQLRGLGIKQSFSASGCPYDNAVAESFFRTFKTEEVYQNRYKTYDDLINSVNEYIEFFNEKRPHERLNYLTPNQIEENYRKTS